MGAAASFDVDESGSIDSTRVRSGARRANEARRWHAPCWQPRRR